MNKEFCIVVITGNKNSSMEYMVASPLVEMKNVTIKEINDLVNNINDFSKPFGGYCKAKFKTLSSDFRRSGFIKKGEML